MRRVQPTTYGELCGANRMGEVDVKAGVMSYSFGAMRVILRFRSSRGVPEVAPMRFEDAGSGAYLVLSAIDTGIVVDVAVGLRCLRLRTLSQQHRTYW